jgi:D-3-phosphoglycerate dehydrogenase
MKDPGPDHELAPGIVTATAERVQREADAIVLHLPLTATTRYFIDAKFLAACERKPVLVNVSRGGLVDNEALVQALDRRLVSGAALDVVEGEPRPSARIIGRPDVIATPHIAFLSDASLRELRRRSSEDVVRVLRGEKPLNPCNASHVSR